VIFEAIETALATATKKRHARDIEVRVAIDRESGDYETFRRWQVIADEELMEFPDRQFTYSAADEMEPQVFRQGQKLERRNEITKKNLFGLRISRRI
jgi:N utilization substance protein A